MTTPTKIRRLLSEANPVPDPLSVHDDDASEALFLSISRRAGVRTATPTGSVSTPKRSWYRRPVTVSAAAALVVILLMVPVLLLSLSADGPTSVEPATEPTVVPTTIPATTTVPAVESTVAPPSDLVPLPEDDGPTSVEPVVEAAVISATVSATISSPIIESTVTPFSGADPQWVETKLTASDGFIADTFGFTVAVDVDRIVVGAPHRTEGGMWAGAVYVFDSDGTGGWNETKLIASDGDENSQFGMSVAVDGDRIVVGAPFDLEGGSAYVFDRSSDGTWAETKLTASDSSGGDDFGSSVAVDGDRVVVGAGGVNDNTGAVYVFDSDGGDGWTATKLTASDGAPRTYFGFWADRGKGMPVAADGGRIVTGSRSSFGETGVYVYEPDGAGGWVETKLAEFGFGVNIDGDRVVISDESAVHVFEPDGAGGWTETRVMISDRAPGDPILRMTQSKGLPVAAADGRIVFASFPIDTEFVSTMTGSVDPAEQMGPVYVFDPEGSNEWTETNLNVPTHNQIIGFVFAVAADGDRVVVGALGITGGSQGAVYVYEHTQN